MPDPVGYGSRVRLHIGSGRGFVNGRKTRNAVIDSVVGPAGSSLYADAHAVGEAPSRAVDKFPFMLVGSGSEGARIIDQNRQTIRSAPVGGTIFSFRISKNKKWVLIHCGDAGYAIASAETFEDIARPPIRPDGFEDATWFRWLILDDDHLIGQADLPSLDPGVGMTLSEKDSLPPRDTLIYIYTLSSGTTTRAEVDGVLTRPFNIYEGPEGRVLISDFHDLETFGVKIIQIPEP